MTSSTAAAPTALLLSPHPDDELLCCPAHLFALRDAGWRIVNLAMSLGRPEQVERRRRELAEACARARFELTFAPDGMLDDRAASQRRALRFVLDTADALGADLLVAPSPHDDHRSHELAGRLSIAALRGGGAARLWLWGLWSELSMPTSMCAFGEPRLAEIEHALAAHQGELERNDYRRLLRGRAAAAAVLLPERLFGHGRAGCPAGALAEAVCEVTLTGGELMLAAPALLDASSGGQVAPPAGSAAWLEMPSPRELSRRPGARRR